MGKGAGPNRSRRRMAALRAGASRWQSGRKKFLLYDGPPGGRLEHGYLLTAGRGRLLSHTLDLGDLLAETRKRVGQGCQPTQEELPTGPRSLACWVARSTNPI